MGVIVGGTLCVGVLVGGVLYYFKRGRDGRLRAGRIENVELSETVSSSLSTKKQQSAFVPLPGTDASNPSTSQESSSVSPYHNVSGVISGVLRNQTGDDSKVVYENFSEVNSLATPSKNPYHNVSDVVSGVLGSQTVDNSKVVYENFSGIGSAKGSTPSKENSKTVYTSFLSADSDVKMKK